MIMNKTLEDRRANASLPKAKIQTNRFSWLYWLVPVGAVALCGWFVYRDVIAGGPTVSIFFQDADGVEEKNTQVKFRGANVGEVKSLELTKDHKLVRVTVRLVESAATLARSGSVFWIVRPEVRVGNVTGLGTIVSGEYIGVQPGAGPPTNTFMGADKEPLAEKPGALQIILRAPDLSSLQELSPIYYRGIEVGEVLYFQLGDDAREVVIHARIDPEYAPLVRSETKFWNAGGIDFRFGLFKGLQINAESPKTVLSGGIEFATPPEAQSPVTNGASFMLFEKPEDKWKTWAPPIKLNLPEKADQTNAAPGLNLK
jgi:paraquat-inducible protein B